MEAHTMQRIGAYFVDAILLSLFVMLLTFWIPTSEKYEEAIKDENNLLDSIFDEDLDFDKFYDDYSQVRYTLDKESMAVSLVTAVVSLGYFATFAYYYNGQTLGKKIFKIKIVSSTTEEVSHLKFIGRALLVNGILSSLLTDLILLFINYKQYNYTVGVVNFVQSAFMFVSLILIIMRTDKKGLHDLMFKTRVIQE